MKYKRSKLEEMGLDFAVIIVQLHDFLFNTIREYTISKQIVKSGTSIGANIAEAQGAQSDADFIAKLHISLKEARETEYWIELLLRSNKISQELYDFLINHLDPLISYIILTLKKRKASLKTP